MRLLPKQVTGEAFVNCRYELSVSGQTHKGTIDATGLVIAQVPRRAKKAELRLWEMEGDRELSDAPHVWAIMIDKMPPITEVAGVQRRLQNLGFDIGDDAEGVEGPGTRAAVRAFEEWVGLKSAPLEYKKTGKMTSEAPISDEVRTRLEKLCNAPPGMQHAGPLPTKGDEEPEMP